MCETVYRYFGIYNLCIKCINSYVCVLTFFMDSTSAHQLLIIEREKYIHIENCLVIVAQAIKYQVM